jgi:hypothetical protein
LSAAQDVRDGVALGGSGSFLYVAGGFTGTADFDPGTSALHQTSAGLEDVFRRSWSSDLQRLAPRSRRRADAALTPSPRYAGERAGEGGDLGFQI